MRSQVTARDMLYEYSMRGFFLLKAAFVHLDSEAGNYAVEHPADITNPFYLALATYMSLCKAIIEKYPQRGPKRCKMVQFARQALCSVAGLDLTYHSKEGSSNNSGPETLLLGGFLAIERALHVLGILNTNGKGVETYGACCAAFRERCASQQPPWSARGAVVVALDVVTGITGRDPRDPANWVAPEAADWEHITQISHALWSLLDPENDPFNSLHRESGGPSP